MLRTFGPAVYHEPDGTFRAVCTYCMLRIGNKCTYSDHRRVVRGREIPDVTETPDWCAMREEMIADAKRAAMRGQEDGTNPDR